MSSLSKQYLFSLLLLLPLMASLPPAVANDALRGQVEVLDIAGADGNPHGLRNIAELAEIYANRNYQPLWFDGGPLSLSRDVLVQEIAASAEHGFPLGRYHYQQLLTANTNEAAQDLLYTDALLSQARDRFSGVVRQLEEDWFIERQRLDAVNFLGAIIAEPDSLGVALQGLWPRHPEYRALLEKRAQLAAMPDAHTERVPPGPLLRKGNSGPRVKLLQARLLGPGDYSGEFDASLEQAVREFQRGAGLDADGLVGPGTLEMLNANRFSWIDRIDANLERWRWLPREIPQTYIAVNIAAFRLRVVEGGEPALGMDVIVGRPYRQTPIFTESLKYLVFYPYWNVPYSIASKDKLPLLRIDPQPLAEAGYEVQLGGEDTFIPVDEVDWSVIKRGEFVLRQRPGEANALGRVKFMLPNTHNVYLHDTPDKALFDKSERVFSSGCIRLAEPRKLAEWVLAYDNSKYLANLDRLLEAGPTTTAYLTRPIPVYMVYFTAFLEGGEVVFRRDVYERDQRIIDQLKAGAQSGFALSAE